MIYIIIPVHNRVKLTYHCLKSLENQKFKDFKIIVIDDGSTDGTCETLKNDFPYVKIAKGDGNLWWAGSINKGLDALGPLINEQDYFLTLNNDLYVDEDYLNNLWLMSRKHPNAIIGSVTININDQRTILDAGSTINWQTAKYTQMLNMQNICKIDQNKCLEVDILSGRGTLVPFRILSAIGNYNAKLLPHYGADNEYSVRAKRAGFQLIVAFSAKVYSHQEETGLNNNLRPLTWFDLSKSFFSIKSPNCIYYRWQFAKLCYPERFYFKFFLFDSIRLIFSSIQNQFTKKNEKSSNNI